MYINVLYSCPYETVVLPHVQCYYIELYSVKHLYLFSTYIDFWVAQKLRK